MRIDKFNGLNNQQAPTEFGLGDMVEAKNVDITDAGKLRLRNGKGSRVITAAIEAACSTGEGEALYQSGNALYLMASNTPASVKTGLSVTNFLTCAKVNNDIYWSNGVQRGYIRNNQAFDFIDTSANPPASQFNGLMPPGDYLYAVTYNDANGFEYSCMAGNSIEITQGGIEVELYSAPSNATHANLYLTHANGSMLYHAVRLDIRPVGPDGAVPTHIMYAGTTTDLATPISNQFCDTPPAFSMAGFYKGRMYYVIDNILYASKPYNYHLIDMAVDFVMFPAMIQLMMPAESGIYVVTSTETVFLSGNDPQDFVLNKVLDYGGVRGTGQRIYASTINPQQAGNVWLWASNRGLVGGFDDGSVSNLTDQVFAFPNSIGGTSALREENGLRQLLITL